MPHATTFRRSDDGVWSVGSRSVGQGLQLQTDCCESPDRERVRQPPAVATVGPAQRLRRREPELRVSADDTPTLDVAGNIPAGDVSTSAHMTRVLDRAIEDSLRRLAPRRFPRTVRCSQPLARAPASRTHESPRWRGVLINASKKRPKGIHFFIRLTLAHHQRRFTIHLAPSGACAC